MEPTRYLLPESEIPRRWYNVAADMPTPLLPPLHPGTGQPIGPDALAPLFPMSLIEQEVSRERWIDIPEPIIEAYALWRPTPLHRARRLERALGTPARIYYKNESVSPAGSHKPNTAVPQAWYNKQARVKRLATETGAGQWGSALAFATSLFGLACQVYMVRVSYEQKPYRKALIESWGARVIPSPSEETQAGRGIRAATPDSPGSLGIAISEAVEDAASREDTKYALGSVLNHVMLHQTVIGLETQKQLALAGEKGPDAVIACCGGGSNFAGLAFPFAAEKIAGKEMRIIAAEPAACPTLTRGRFAYDFGDTARLTPLLPMHTLGHSFIPPGIHAGGLRYHGDAPLVCQLLRDGVIEAVAHRQRECFEAALLFARTEGILPAPETSHAIRAAVAEAEAERAKEEGRERVILFNLSGHGHFDMASYAAYLSGNLQDYELPQEAIDSAIAELAGLPQPC